MYEFEDEESLEKLFDNLESMWADHEADRILHTDYGDRSIDEVEAERRQKLDEQSLAATPSDDPIIDAYHQVYGKLMENYSYTWM